MKNYVLFLIGIIILSSCATVPIEKESKYVGPKKRIAVMDFENKVPSSEYNIGTGMTEMLITALYETNRFIVLERKAINDVIKEQDFGLSGRVQKDTVSKIGRILGAQLLVRGAVTEFDPGSGGAVGGIIRNFGIGIAQRTAKVAVDIRMYDATTGVILESKRIEKSATATGLAFVTHNFGTAGFTKTPIGKATRSAIKEMVKYIVKKMDEIPWEGRIVKASGNKVYINAGKNSNVKLGDVFAIYKKGEELIDPATGLKLGSEDTYAGSIKITQVMEKYAIGEAVEGTGFDRGDLVRIP